MPPPAAMNSASVAFLLPGLLDDARCCLVAYREQLHVIVLVECNSVVRTLARMRAALEHVEAELLELRDAGAQVGDADGYMVDTGEHLRLRNVDCLGVALLIRRERPRAGSLLPISRCPA